MVLYFVLQPVQAVLFAGCLANLGREQKPSWGISNQRNPEDVYILLVFQEIVKQAEGCYQ